MCAKQKKRNNHNKSIKHTIIQTHRLDLRGSCWKHHILFFLLNLCEYIHFIKQCHCCDLLIFGLAHAHQWCCCCCCWFERCVTYYMSIESLRCFFIHSFGRDQFFLCSSFFTLPKCSGLLYFSHLLIMWCCKLHICECRSIFYLDFHSYLFSNGTRFKV